jgi:S-adenosylmethionine synthetase
MNNKKREYIFTSESVTEGHPDKMADQISDAILDYIIERDPTARVACETLVSNGFCIITGELKTEIYAPMQDIAREVIREIGYTNSAFGFDYRSAGILNGIGEQSMDISQGVDQESGELGAGDQGMMFGYACLETPECMPLAISLAHKITAKLAEVRKNGTIPFIRPDGKAQVSVRYIDGKAVSVDTVVVSTQHGENISQKILRDAVITEVIEEVIPKEFLSDKTTYHINPTGRFVIGGPQGDAGLTGRKIVVDSYGGYAPHGGGAFSGKDPTKVDRSGAYMARYIAKNLVVAGVCSRVTIQLSYAMGVSTPISLMVDTHGTGRVDELKIEECIVNLFDLTPNGIIKELNLLRPIYKKTACYGHFGREDEGFSWERLDRVDDIKNYLF